MATAEEVGGSKRHRPLVRDVDGDDGGEVTEGHLDPADAVPRRVVEQDGQDLGGSEGRYGGCWVKVARDHHIQRPTFLREVAVPSTLQVDGEVSDSDEGVGAKGVLLPPGQPQDLLDGPLKITNFLGGLDDCLAKVPTSWVRLVRVQGTLQAECESS